MTNMMNILELYSGIGGFHFAIQGVLGNGSERPYQLCAVDINTTANHVYRHNHSGSNVKLLERNIQSFNESWFDSINIDLLTMSPPCQPFTRLGKQLDVNDERCNSLQHVIQTINKLTNKPRYIMLENVKGFETSQAHHQLLSTLIQNGYMISEYLLSPEQFCIPNSRLRYYLLAKLGKVSSNSQEDYQSNPIHTLVPVLNHGSIFNPESNISYYPKINFNTETNQIETSNLTKPTLEQYIETISDKEYGLSDEQLYRYHDIIDIVQFNSSSTNCFTKSYGHRLEACGSILQTSTQHNLHDIYKQIQLLKNEASHSKQDIINLLHKLQLRFFTPSEISKLMSFPKHFRFPDDLNVKQRYRLLGNSVNVLVCQYLLKLLLDS